MAVEEVRIVEVAGQQVRVRAGEVAAISEDATLFDLAKAWEGFGDREDSGKLIWGTALVLARRLMAKDAHDIAGKDIIELGAGTGVLGIAMAPSSNSITLTDHPGALETLHDSIALNPDIVCCSDNTVCAVGLDWYASPPETLMGKFDTAIASDCVYEGLKMGQALISTASKVLKKGGRLVILSACHRDGVHEIPSVLEMSGDWVEVTCTTFKDGDETMGYEEYVYITSTLRV